MLIDKLLEEGLDIKPFSTSNITELQQFLSYFNDFFLLCEGKEGSAEGILKACPPSKNIEEDKFVFGIYEEDELIGMIDLIQNYPKKKTWTIGYFLIHPNYQSKKKGRFIIYILSSVLHKLQGKKMRCVVQSQNPRALHFWKKCEFDQVKSSSIVNDSTRNQNYILEKEI